MSQSEYVLGPSPRTPRADRLVLSVLMNDSPHPLIRTFAGRRVLLAERSDHLRGLISSQINQWRLRTVNTACGLHTLQHALLASQTRTPFDLLLINSVLPDLDGLTITHRLRNARCASPIIMLGGASDDEQAHQSALDAGAQAYLPRPFGPDELGQCMYQVLNEICV